MSLYCNGVSGADQMFQTLGALTWKSSTSTEGFEGKKITGEP